MESIPKGDIIIQFMVVVLGLCMNVGTHVNQTGNNAWLRRIPMISTGFRDKIIMVGVILAIQGVNE